MDIVNWEAVRVAFNEEISYAISNRGMHEKLANRIQAFLERLVRYHGDVDLEWLRDASPQYAKDLLMSIDGIGLKSVECIRLLELNHSAFPVRFTKFMELYRNHCCPMFHYFLLGCFKVDINVARIVVRLGWVPLKPLPETLSFHLIQKYPAAKSVHQYLWPRLSTLDVKILYELHCQLITFGKVFCTKTMPNCKACPMKLECKHFASKNASSKPAVPSLTCTSTTELTLGVPSLPKDNIVEDIEDFCYQNSEEIPLVHLWTKLFKNHPRYKEKLAEIPLIPMPKVKFKNQLRTVHLVYVLLDGPSFKWCSCGLGKLFQFDKRDPDDCCPYLLAIWKGEGDELEDQSGQCFPLKLTQERNNRTVFGTFLIPCRTAMRGSFPFNGTHFQVNEMFADDESSRVPIAVPWKCICSLQKRSLCCGISLRTIFKGKRRRNKRF